MDKIKISMLEKTLYDLEDKSDVISCVSKISDAEMLYVYAYNYNWDDGIEIPKHILKNKCCDLSTALLLFYRAEGVSYLLDKNGGSDTEWKAFIAELYNSILNKKYKKGGIEFRIPLSKVELFKVKKAVSENEKVFLEDIEGKSLDISI